MNERFIENQVTENLKKTSMTDYILEYQSSENERIKKCLKIASKSKKGGVGRPEHIITFQNHFDFVIITEVKKNKSLHESKKEINPEKYAVDGVKHYSNHLSKEFNVLSIAISGENIDEVNVSHFYQRKNSSQVIEVLGYNLLNLESYLNFYTNNEITIREDYDSLKTFAQQLNTKLHTNKILESQRSLLLCAVLIALNDKSFKESYLYVNNPAILSTTLHQTLCNQINNLSELHFGETEKIKSEFSFLKTDTTLNSQQNILKDIIYDIDINIKNFIKTNKFQDILSEIYNIFLTYSNSDKGLGIVLTPSHICDFCCEISELDENSKFLDLCAGTGGFVISALKYMINGANGNQKLVEHIKSNNIIGVEYQSHIYALLASNLLINDVRLKNIFSGSCFDEKNQNLIKTKKPNVSFINPPYKGDKKKDTEELQFVYSMLDLLEINGTGIAILPMSCAVSHDSKIVELRKQILRKHTLEGVLSLPDELFYNSNASVVSCIMIFKAHKKHNLEKNVFFGYFKDDGFRKKKSLGRIDFDNNWSKIKNKWVDFFINKKEENGFSVLKKITENSEWAVENFLKTDYKKLNKKIFEKNLHIYSSYLFSNEKIKFANNKKIIEDDVELNNISWEIFKLVDIFEISGTKTTKPTTIKNLEPGEYPYVTTKATNNGVESFHNLYTENGNVITVDSAVIGYSAYQYEKFIASDHVEKLTPRETLTPYTMLFITTCLNLEQYRFNYGRKASQNRLKNLEIYLPVDNITKNPNYEFMDNFIKSCAYSQNLIQFFVEV
jgi:type I restriction enzyme M protein